MGSFQEGVRKSLRNHGNWESQVLNFLGELENGWPPKWVRAEEWWQCRPRHHPILWPQSGGVRISLPHCRCEDEISWFRFVHSNFIWKTKFKTETQILQRRSSSPLTDNQTCLLVWSTGQASSPPLLRIRATAAPAGPSLPPSRSNLMPCALLVSPTSSPLSRSLSATRPATAAAAVRIFWFHLKS